MSLLYFYRENIFTPPVEGGCPIQNTSVEADDNQPVLKRQVIKAIQDWHARVVHTVKKGKERQEIRPDVKEEDFATRYIGVIEGGIMLARILGDEAHFDVMTRPLLEELDAIRQPISQD
ncbi:MAG: TetR family transcriptional regulator C-terminal domain-containing protein [Bacteroidota bacterium]